MQLISTQIRSPYTTLYKNTCLVQDTSKYNITLDEKHIIHDEPESGRFKAVPQVQKIHGCTYRPRIQIIYKIRNCTYKIEITANYDNSEVVNLLNTYGLIIPTPPVEYVFSRPYIFINSQANIYFEDKSNNFEYTVNNKVELKASELVESIPLVNITSEVSIEDFPTDLKICITTKHGNITKSYTFTEKTWINLMTLITNYTKNIIEDFGINYSDLISDFFDIATLPDRLSKYYLNSCLLSNGVLSVGLFSIC
jgi:hypothetical protein